MEENQTPHSGGAHLSQQACLRLSRALAPKVHENWIEAMQYLYMEPPLEQKRKPAEDGRCCVKRLLHCGRGSIADPSPLTLD